VPTATTGPNELTFPSERERAERAVNEFQQVAAKYGDPYRAKARYFMAVNLLTIDRNRGFSELESLAQTAKDETRAWARFALAQAREADRQYDPAIMLYGELLKEKAGFVPSNTVKLRLAAILEKQGKRKEASDILFDIAESARNARDSAGKAVPPSSAAREAAQKLESLDPERFAQLSPDPLASGLQL
jgi:tetratricopeptide (TPR) repeat protein